MSLETVSYRKIGMNGTLEGTLTGVLALRRAEGTAAVMVGDSRVIVRTLRFHLQASTLPDGHRCRLEDQLLDADGQKWVITGFRLATLGTRWAVETQEKIG